MGDVPAEPSGFGHHLKTAIVGAHDTLADKIDERKKAHVAGVLEQFETDIAPMLAPLIEEVLANPGTPDHMKALLTQVGAPEHFSSSLLIGVAVGAILGPVLGSAVEPFVQNISNSAWAANPSRPLPPDVLAASVLKGINDVNTAAPEAALSGVDRGRFAMMVDASGQSIGLAEALLLYRRNQIDLAHLKEIMQYSNLNPRFYDDVPKLRFAPPSAGEAIAGALKSHLRDDEAKQKLGEAGIDPVNFDWLKATAGRPFSVGEAIDLWNRGEISETRVDEVIAQSDVNPSFGTDYKKLRVYWPPVRSIVPMLRSGSITVPKARDLLAKQGVQPDIIDAFVIEATHTTTSKGKELTQAQILRLFEHQFLTRPEANARLATLGYPAGEIVLLLDAAAGHRSERLTNALITKIGTLYVAHKITKSDAVNALSSGQIPNATQHDLFTAWDIERDANVHVPTAAQLVGAYRRGWLTAAQTKTQLMDLGIAEGDLGVFVAAGYPPTKPAAAVAAALAVTFA